ncbi:MAG: hypothetical protein IJS58_02090 [Bacilli bacterium]|nr:hypothetical protein [Bacilli bacterium]
MTDDKIIKQEYINKINYDFSKISPYSYGSNEWVKIEEKKDELIKKIEDIPFTEEKEIRIDGDDYVLEFEDFVKKMPVLTGKLTAREIFFKSIRDINYKIYKVTSSVWKKIKFLFSIPALAFASFVFVIFINLIFNYVLTLIFPIGFSEEYGGLAQSIIAAILFVILKTLLILDSHDRYLEENWVVYVIKYSISIAIWWTLFFTIRFTTNSTIDQFNYLQWAFFLPFMWLGGITREFFIMGILGYLVVTTLPLIISLPIIFLREREMTNPTLNEKDKKYKSGQDFDGAIIDDDYEYHFDATQEIKNIGFNKKDSSSESSLDESIDTSDDKSRDKSDY